MGKYALVESFLEDEKSKYIFKERHLYNIDNNIMHIENIIKSVDGFCGQIYYPGKELELIEKIKAWGEKPLYIFGGGYKGAKLFRLLKEHAITLTGWLDTNYEKLAEIDGLPVYEPSDEKVKGAIIIVSITKNKTAQSVADLCREYGASQVFLYNDYSIHSIDGQYFDFNIIKLGKKEIFIDAGAFDLATSKEFKKYCEQCEVVYSVYAFEPDKISYEKCLHKITSECLKNIKCFNACLWEEAAVLSFAEKGTGTSSVSDSGTVTVNAIPLDDAGNLEEPTFIKMDVEGAELSALKGAKKLIAKNHPKLAICLYHKPEDIYDIPIFIKQLDSSYKLYIRHYSNYITETVLYAI